MSEDAHNIDNTPVGEKLGYPAEGSRESMEGGTENHSPFITWWHELEHLVGGINEANGWRKSKRDLMALVEVNGIPEQIEYLKAVLAGNELALIHSEASEALEGVRHGTPKSDHIPEFNTDEEELADIVIRVMDYAQERKLRVPEAIIAKLSFNAKRGHRHGGKLS